MPKAKIAITLEAELLREVDALVRQRRFANRSQAVEMAVRSTLDRLQRTRLAEACNQLDPDEERALAEEGIAGELAEWPKY